MKPRIEDMHPDLKTMYFPFAAKMAERGIPFGLSCVIRTKAEQEAFYAQGRESLENVNAKRLTAAMPPISDVENDAVVTHTLNSRHFPDENGKSRAFDIEILMLGGRPTWSLKFDGDKDGTPDYIESAEIGRDCGLDCGAFWESFHDWCHYQLFDKVGEMP